MKKNKKIGIVKSEEIISKKVVKPSDEVKKYKFEFTEELDKIVQSTYKKIHLLLKDAKIDIMSLEYRVQLEDGILKKYGLTSDVGFIVNVSDGAMIYTYKGIKLEPICYYLRPVDYHEVTTLQILQQCVL